MDSTLEALVREAGYDLAELKQKASAVVLVGSRATQHFTESSDYDLVVLDYPDLDGPKHKRVRTAPGLDLMFESPDADPSPWLSRELAIHMTGYGVWRSGKPSWGLKDLLWTRACDRKLDRTTRKAASMAESWDKMNAKFQEKNLRKLMYWARYLLCLQIRMPLPPKPLLPQSFDVGTVGRFGEQIRDLIESDLEG